ncbi:IQ motif and ankyrin repeat domain-containing protein [Oopsacas minuta]|uniref:IQ motif and ankyrin repeat domain-containing protein n=1 Tax=Oopsacas minuta TaxID=111878 RepID=A0AAV7KHI0_9METZ|nr:IQ motif and ankyrin repeat domain-containing protein [Oopsacas minuta]
MPVKRGVPGNRPAPVSSRGKPVPKSTIPLATASRGVVRRTAPASLRGTGRGGASRLAAQNSGKNSQKTIVDKQQPKKPQQTKQDLMAIRIQTFVRAFLSRRRLLLLRQRKQEYDDLMDKLQHEAYLHMVRMEREEIERQVERDGRERRRKQEITRRKKRMLDAAFEGDTDEIEHILKESKEQYISEGGANDSFLLQRVEHLLVECTDANGNTPLSEAAAGGSIAAVALLIELGGDPNSVGQFGRTPLYRAAFAGHKAVCEYLLSQGADPRVYAEDGALPQHIASNMDIEQMISEWDMEETEKLLVTLSERREKQIALDAARKQEEKDLVIQCIEELEQEYNAKQLELSKAHQELEKRINEHDTLVTEGHQRTDLTIPAIQDAEGNLEIAKLHAEQTLHKLQAARLELREKSVQDVAGEGGFGVKANIKELEEVLMRDIGNKIKESGKWPMIIDPSGQVSIFLKYRDTNYTDMFISKHTEPETVRLALLGALRFGKMFVIDMRDVDMWYQVGVMLDQVQPGLLASILSRDIMVGEKYLSLVRPGDGEEYQKVNFMHGRVDKFCLTVLTKMSYPPETLLDIFYTITVVTQQ